MNVQRLAGSLARSIVDFALPPRCPGCGIIVDAPHRFCAPCWSSLRFLRQGGCETCGIPLEATESETCAACLAKPPPIHRTRSAVAYDELSRLLAIRLKYGRKVALARTMAHFMLPHLDHLEGKVVLVPVPLHRSRLWTRGFNQSVLLANALGRASGLEVRPALLRRTRRTPPLKGMSQGQRRRIVAGAFAATATDLGAETFVLVDDVLTSGSTAEACAHALKRAGARRIELVTWTRVIRPSRRLN